MGKHKVYCASGLGWTFMNTIDCIGKNVFTPGACCTWASITSRFGGNKAMNALFGRGESGVLASWGNVHWEK